MANANEGHKHHWRVLNVRAVDAVNSTQQHRAWLHWEVAILTVRRLGHILELDDPSKAVSPSRQMVLIGVRLDADRLEFELDPLKRSSYADSLTLWLQKGTLPVARLTSLAFKMLVVCECYPLARQWLHPIFRSLRGQRQRPVILNDEPEVDHVLRPPRDPRVVAYQLARLGAARSVAASQSTSDEREWLILSFIMCFIDDFGACSIADLLFRIDGSPVRDAAGIRVWPG